VNEKKRVKRSTDEKTEGYNMRRDGWRVPLREVWRDREFGMRSIES
jgi:hypothetical protein